MSAIAAWTELAIWILLAGAPIVFAWFLRDAVRVLRGLGGPRGDPGGRDAAEEGSRGAPRGPGRNQ